MDDQYRILLEYQNKTAPHKGKGVGDVFVQWALRHQAQPNHVQQIVLTEHKKDCYKEFPDSAFEAVFDAPDRKFVAVAHSHPDGPPIWQAADCKWLDWWPTLNKYGVNVEFLCAEDICRFYANKFPTKVVPVLP